MDCICLGEDGSDGEELTSCYDPLRPTTQDPPG